MTELTSNGNYVARHLCERHLRDQVRLSAPPSDENPLAFVSRLRSLLKSIKMNGVMPPVSELGDFAGLFQNLSNGIHGTEWIDLQLTYLEKFADFVELHDRFPTDEELPDAF